MTERSSQVNIIYVMEAAGSRGDEAGAFQHALIRETLEGSHLCRLILYDLGEEEDARYRAMAESENQKVRYIHAPKETPWACFNDALDKVKQGWIQFIRSSASYDVSKTKAMIAAAELEGCSAFSLTPVQKAGGKEKTVLSYTQRGCRVDLSEGDRRMWNPVLDGYFLRRENIGDLRFETEEVTDPEMCFLIRCFDKDPVYYIFEERCVIERFLITDHDSYRPAFIRDWYLSFADRVGQPILNSGSDSRLCQSGILYLLECRLRSNRNNLHKEALSSSEIEDFYSMAGALLQQIDDRMIADWDETSTAYDRVLMLHLLDMKYGGRSCDPVIREDGAAMASPGGEKLVLANVSEITFQVDAINYTEDGLLIDGEIKNIPWAEHSRLEAGAWCGEHRIDAVKTDICRFEKLFGKSIWRAYMVQIRIPEAWLDGSDIRFAVTYLGREYPCRRLLFARIQARLHHRYKNSYWVFGRHILYRPSGEPQMLAVEPYSTISKLRRERKLLQEIKDPSLRRLRTMYHLTAPLYRGKRIWITYDQLFKGGDNGEYFFRYVTEQHGNDVQMYYLVNEDFTGFDTKEHKDRLLFAGSSDRKKRMKTWLTALHADMIFSTRASVDSFFDLHRSGVRAAVCDLYQPKIVCLQHGLTVQKIAQYQNRLQDNMRHYFCASPFEGELLCRPVFGYEEDMISVTGSPRYDGLTGTAQKQILICPTWRRNVTDGMNEKGKQYGYNPSFRDTAFCRIYQRLISDPRLNASAKEHGYRILLVLHPNIGSQERDFLHDETVQVVSGVDVDYESLMGVSQLMVTDYSGVRFDFAYMRRPLIYYRPEELPPQYEEGVGFEDMQFGPVCREHEEVVEQLCRMMENACWLEDEYRDKIDRFFPYSDQKNCERVYEAAWKFQKQHIEGKR